MTWTSKAWCHYTRLKDLFFSIDPGNPRYGTASFDADENGQNELRDLLSQRDAVDIHGVETRRANLRLDLETLLKTVQVHYRPAIFERCLLVLERLAEGYTRVEIRLELAWTEVTYESTRRSSVV